jgi:hypothetical protein
MPVNCTFRFYEELNDFLGKQHRKREFEQEFHARTTVKDAIEALGVPHTEIDLILVNGTSVDFTYRLQNEDRVVVYPVFESLDITGLQYIRKAALRDPRFILDVHLGKLTRYLRMAGFDCLYKDSFTDADLIRISTDEKRILLTRDKGILKNSLVTRGLYVRADNPGKQFGEIARRLHLEDLFRPFSRCMLCNEVIVAVDKQSVLDQLEPLTREHYHIFQRCKGCGRIYWEGSHVERMKERMKWIRLVK